MQLQGCGPAHARTSYKRHLPLPTETAVLLNSTMTDTSEPKELPVTFHPALYLQRRGWVLDIMRREGVKEVRSSTYWVPPPIAPPESS